MDVDPVLDAVGQRLRSLRQQRQLSLAGLSATTGISTSTLSRLESGGRKPTLELLLALSRAYQVPLDDLVGAPPVGDPRVQLQPLHRNGQTLIPLTQRPGGPRAYKMIVPPVGAEEGASAEQKAHEGYEWMYVLSGQLRLRLAEHDFVMKAGEVAEFDTRVPHWFGSAGPEPAEVLALFGPQGERMHVRARPRARSRDSRLSLNHGFAGAAVAEQPEVGVSSYVWVFRRDHPGKPKHI
jgi:transcriptional regulator with XRE-family HTH domain